jgi:putative nucleotidyltransferase with HDIG domain
MGAQPEWRGKSAQAAGLRQLAQARLQYTAPTRGGSAARVLQIPPMSHPSVQSQIPNLQPTADAYMREGREHESAGRLAEAASAFAAAIDASGREDDDRTRAEALRRLGVTQHRRGEREEARRLVRESYEYATAMRDPALAAEALNTLGAFDLDAGEYDAAREILREALRQDSNSPALRGRIEQNLGILANIRGEHAEAMAHYERSLEEFRASHDARGCALSFNNLGLISADQRRWADADRYFRQCRDAAEHMGDVHLRGLAILNRTEVLIARKAFEEALRDAQEALAIFDSLGARLNKSDAYCTLGVIYRETGRSVLAEARLKTAIEIAAEEGLALEEAEASRELARLYQDQNRNQDALRLLNASHRLFGRLDARVDLVDVAAKTAELERVYFAVVRGWGQSIESADSYTHGHCERVADFSSGISQRLGLDDQQRTTVRIGAYLHDLGKVRVPHEILNKTGKLTPEEFGIMKMHPVWGVDMLSSVEFPWDIKPMIRWHHEKHDGTGYPDGLGGDEIPLNAQIICAADVYDALTTNRSYRAAMSHAEAMDEMRRCGSFWRPDVFAALVDSLREPQPSLASASIS